MSFERRLICDFCTKEILSAVELRYIGSDPDEYLVGHYHKCNECKQAHLVVGGETNEL